jgi:hypothetical protein
MYVCARVLECVSVLCMRACRGVCVGVYVCVCVCVRACTGGGGRVSLGGPVFYVFRFFSLPVALCLTCLFLHIQHLSTGDLNDSRYGKCKVSAKGGVSLPDECTAVHVEACFIGLRSHWPGPHPKRGRGGGCGTNFPVPLTKTTIDLSQCPHLNVPAGTTQYSTQHLRISEHKEPCAHGAATNITWQARRCLTLCSEGGQGSSRTQEAIRDLQH